MIGAAVVAMEDYPREGSQQPFLKHGSLISLAIRSMCDRQHGGNVSSPSGEDCTFFDTPLKQPTLVKSTSGKGARRITVRFPESPMDIHL